MKIAVTAASGQLGRAIINELKKHLDKSAFDIIQNYLKKNNCK